MSASINVLTSEEKRRVDSVCIDREQARRGLEETNWDMSTSTVKSFRWPVFPRPWEPCKNQPHHPLCGANQLHQHPPWPGRAAGGHGSWHGRWSTSEENQVSSTHPIIRLFVREGESRLSWMGGWVDGPVLSPPHPSAKLIGMESKQGGLVGSLQANQKPCQQSAASTMMFLSPHLPPLGLHPVMPPEHHSYKSPRLGW